MNDVIENKLSILKAGISTATVGTMPAVFSDDTVTYADSFDLQNISDTSPIIIGTNTISLLTNMPSDITSEALYVSRFIFNVKKKDDDTVAFIVINLIELEPIAGETWNCVYDVSTSSWTDWVKGNSKNFHLLDIDASHESGIDGKENSYFRWYRQATADGSDYQEIKLTDEGAVVSGELFKDDEVRVAAEVESNKSIPFYTDTSAITLLDVEDLNSSKNRPSLIGTLINSESKEDIPVKNSDFYAVRHLTFVPLVGGADPYFVLFTLDEIYPQAGRRWSKTYNVSALTWVNDWAANVAMFSVTATVAASSWVTNTDSLGYNYRVDISVTSAMPYHFPIVTFDDDSIAVAKTAQVKNVAKTSAGLVSLYANKVPTDSLTITIYLSTMTN